MASKMITLAYAFCLDKAINHQPIFACDRTSLLHHSGIDDVIQSGVRIDVVDGDRWLIDDQG